MSGENLGIPEEKPATYASPWAPLREPVFRMLWLVWVAANVSMWMNDVAAAWLMTSLTTSPTLIAMVQTASALPVFLLGLPSGALADIVDRRRYFMFTQVWLAANAALLYLASISGLLNATLLLVLVFVNGIGLAMRWPVFAAIVPEIVPRHQLTTALALNAVAMNISRVVGPLVAGLVISAAGSEWVFGLNFVLAVGAAIAISRWKREKKASILPGERFLGAMRLGWQYVRESRRMRGAITRTAAFFFHSTALIALLPLVAKGMEGGGAAAYTVLLAALGGGAIFGVTRLTRLRPRWNRNRLTEGGTVVQALSMIAVAFSPNLWVAAPAMFVGGIAWILVANSVTTSAQLALPNWVRARGMSIYQMAIMGSSALGALAWGKVAAHAGVPWSITLAAVSALFALALTLHLSLEGAADEDHTPTHPWQEPVPAKDIAADSGPVMCTIEYLIDPARGEEFEALMEESRSMRLRNGAVSWGLFEDVQRPGRYVEYFACETWADYLRRFDRFTAADERNQAARYAFHRGEGPPQVSRFIARHPETLG
jgi:MFS family permease